MDRYRLFLENETVTRALKNDEEHELHGLEFEHIYSLPSKHYSNSIGLIIALENSTHKDEARNFGMLAFLSMVMGLEAFINTYFLYIAGDGKVEKVRSIVRNRSGSTKDRTKELIKICGLELLNHQEIILAIKYLSEKRNELVHPKPIESSVELIGETVRKQEKLHIPPWPRFGKKETCLLMLDWCLFLPASCAQAYHTDTRKFMLQWTGLPTYDPHSIIEDVSKEVRTAQKDGVIT